MNNHGENDTEYNWYFRTAVARSIDDRGRENGRKLTQRTMVVVCLMAAKIMTKARRRRDFEQFIEIILSFFFFFFFFFLLFSVWFASLFLRK